MCVCVHVIVFVCVCVCVWPRPLLALEFGAAMTVTKMAFVTISSLSVLAGCSPDPLLGSVLSIKVR